MAHFDPADAHHGVAMSLLHGAADQIWLAHTLSLAEVLVGGVRAGYGDQMLSDLRAIGVEAAAPIDDEPLRLAELRATTGLRLPDCCVLCTATSNGAALATFDRALAAAARDLGVAVVS